MKAAEAQAQVSDYWTRRAPAFDGAASHVAQASLWRDVLAAAFETEDAKDVVDLGTGTGACALIAASLGHRVRACDGSEGMLAAARKAAEASGLDVTFEQALIEEATFAPASADIVTLRNVLWTLPDPMAALRKAQLILRPSGLVLVSDGLWSVAAQYRSTYPDGLAASLPRHDGLTEDETRTMLSEAGFGPARSWQHLFPASPYPGDVPMFVLTARKG
ncbi:MULTISPECIES: class I SAM-dependent methyltransferase [unclassified Bosea (in: a-proteobacteria)]|uniref:class I SAM-dependent methyltransferase n=1 Tax=unclassified Bosea (in: a-proteobacteria) TaxID=2653178 RepID=UPI000F75C3FC|nr:MULTISPECIES: class I SAM-dependent methyltransferase [unclassified Bosea (in: a-proteobacteria)]AZO80183.1 methyltransferase type 11 [Bosea sp. Tri-49]RXT22976.1 methyltransferase type 11 [Bosea sp. Tri-39]RXT38446.1 methyltransferase type 11 [Bosea sp. Tri-54]